MTRLIYDHSGLFLPSYEATKLSFIRAILQNKKKVLKSNEIKKITVPMYAEISVKNLYDDAMNDQELKQYLPDLEQSSGKLPEREFFFSVMNTIKQDYLSKIIEIADQKRFK
jgi:hypothetical protein